MSESPKHSASTRWLLFCGLLVSIVAAAFEIQGWLAAPPDWTRPLSGLGVLTLAAYIALLLLGLVLLASRWFWSGRLNMPIGLVARTQMLRWLTAAILLLSVAWFYLYSPWQGAWPGPWTQLVAALALAACVAWLMQPAGSPPGREIALALAIFLYPRVVLELRAWYTLSLVYRGATLLGYLVLAGLAAWLFTERGERLGSRLAAWRDRLGRWRWPIAALFLAGPLILLASAGARFYVMNPSVRFAFLLIEACAAAFLLAAGTGEKLPLKSLILSAFALAAVSFVASSLLLVVSYPFSIGWSEGNRFYDYSLLFGQRLYDAHGVIVNPYGSPGRYVLWGALFLVPGLPIEAHRFWNVLLYTVPPLLVAWLATRKLAEPYLRAGVLLFILLLFTVESPLHPPFLLAAALVMAFMFSPSLVWRGAALALASLYVGASRWTWIPVTAAWGVLADLILYYPTRSGSLIKRLGPTLLVGLAGFLPGLISGYSGLPLSPSAREYKQPLLWYRLLPNPTFPLGVLLSTVLISAPTVILLLWWVRSRRWKLDWAQQLAMSGALLGFLGAGLVVSMKIGGGADLHNLDMYLMTLALVLALGVYQMSQRGRVDLRAWPAWAQLLLAFMIVYPLYEFTPLYSGSASSVRLELAKPQSVTRSLSEIQAQVSQAQARGDVLFMDQRQLLTFGYIQDVPFIPDYEKKYMMDQAMAANAEYFQAYYQDLARKRFSLIVTEILHTRQEQGADFSEENNAWVKWVSEPTLCFYEPTLIDKDTNVELLVPKPNPTGCEQYLRGGE